MQNYYIETFVDKIVFYNNNFIHKIISFKLENSIRKNPVIGYSFS